MVKAALVNTVHYVASTKWQTDKVLLGFIAPATSSLRGLCHHIMASVRDCLKARQRQQFFIHAISVQKWILPYHCSLLQRK